MTDKEMLKTIGQIKEVCKENIKTGICSDKCPFWKNNQCILRGVPYEWKLNKK